MEIAEREERTDRQQGVTLLGTPGTPGHKHKQTKCTAAGRKIITLVSLITLLAVILAIILVWKHYSDVKGEKSWLEEDCNDLETPQCPESFSKPPLLLISLDGFRAGYLNAHGDQLPNIMKLRQCGTSTPYMRPAYPTKTFPNHYTIVTGLYPESHGIVDNRMYDVNRNASFSLKADEKFNPSWYQGEPVWITAMNNNLKSASFFWPGSDVPIKGKYPNKYMKYNSKTLFEDRVRNVLTWLNLPSSERPDFYTLYLEEPDRSGHKFGPNSQQVVDALVNADRIIGMMMDGLKRQKLHKCVNLILLSDHGMEEASCEKAAYVSSYQSNIEDFDVIQGPAARIRPKRLPEQFFTFNYEELVRNLSCRAVDQPMKPYLTEHLPKRLHFVNNVRIERAHLYMKAGWQAGLKPNDVKYCVGGFHGSDNTFRNMQTIFIGYGPGMKFNTTVAPFENIEVYNLLCDLLSIPPAPNNGTHGSLNHLLRNPPHHPVHLPEISSASVCSSVAPSLKDLGCSCALHNRSQVETINRRLIGSNPTAKQRHLPYGAPRVVQQKADYCLLQHSSYVSGYSKDILMPLWVAYSLEPMFGVQPLSSAQEECVHADVRISAEASQSCSFYKNNSTVTYGFLHPPNLAADGELDSLITSNMAPMFRIFKEIWIYFHEAIVVNYSGTATGVNVMSGPIFDNNADGKYDVMKRNGTDAGPAPLPTHFFVILSRCKNSPRSQQRCDIPTETMSFILPHRADNLETCHVQDDHDYSWVPEWLQLHAARIRDIELLTGLSFYPDLRPEDALQLKTFLSTV